MFFTLLFSSLLLLLSAAAETSWPRRLAADPNENFVVLWDPAKEGFVTFEVQVRTKGYVAFGFSPNGGMAGSDIVVGWIDNSGNAFLSDRFSTDFTEPEIDINQDYELLKGYENETHSVLRFRRKLDTCDPQDFKLTNNTIRLIYAWHSEDPTEGGRIRYHGMNRGSVSVLLLESKARNFQVPNDTIVWDIRMPNVTIPNKDTTYWCSYFKLPELPKNHHFIGFEIAIQPGHELLVHHLLVYRCEGNTSSIPRFVENGGHECYMEKSVLDANCFYHTFTWAVGSKGDLLPPHVGIPLANRDGKPTYFVLEMHYNNPELLEGLTDNSGVRVFISPNPRENSAGLFEMANEVNYKHIIPPFQQHFTTTTHCPSECTQKNLPEGGVNFFMIGLHTHLSGRKLRFRHFRNGVELPPISADEYYDFSFQETRLLTPEIKILPGDSFSGECVYETMDRSNATVGGLATFDEMCFFYAYYYPLANLTGCFSSIPDKQFLDWFQIEKVSDNKAFILSPTEYENMTVLEYIKTFDWSSKTPQQMQMLQQYSHYGEHDGFCVGLDLAMKKFTTGYPKIDEPYVPISSSECIDDDPSINQL